MKRRVSHSDKDLLSQNGRRLAVSLFVLLFVVYAFLVFSIAWFTQGTQVSANEMSITVNGKEALNFDLLEWDASLNSGVGDWKSVEQIDLDKVVPNECRRYKIVLLGSTFNKVVFTLQDFTTVNSNPQNENLFDLIYIKNQYNASSTQDPSPMPAFLGFSDTALSNPAPVTPVAPVSAAISASDVYVLNATAGSNSIIFDIYFSKTICNYYDDWGMSGTLKIE